MRAQRVRWLTVIAVALTASACLESRQGSLLGDTAATVDTAEIVDAATADTDAACPDPAGAAIVITRVGVLSAPALPAGYDAAFTATTDALLLAAPGTTGSNAADDDEILRVRPGAGLAPEQLTFNADRDNIVTARGDAVLVDRSVGWESRSVVLVTSAGETVLGGERQAIWLSTWGQGGAKPRWLGADLAAWTSCVLAPSACQEINLQVYDGATTSTLRTVAAPRVATTLYGPSADGRVVVFAERPDDPAATWALVAWDADTREEHVVATGLALSDAPVVSGDAAFITTSDRVERVDLASGARTTVAAGQCLLISVDGDRALVVCRAIEVEGGVPVTLPLADGVLSYYDGAALHVVDDTAGSVASARMRGPLIGWLAYASPTPGCTERDAGEIRLAHANAPGVTRVVGPVGIGCLCCGAYWPEPQLEVGDGFVAWNYVTPSDPDALTHGFPLGFALVTADPLACAPERR